MQLPLQDWLSRAHCQAAQKRLCPLSVMRSKRPLPELQERELPREIFEEVKFGNTPF
jgi:hypothetical protein